MILIVDDNPGVCEALELLFSLHGLKTASCASPEEALAYVAANDVDVVVQDMNFGANKTSGEDGVALFHALREQDPELPVVLLTAWTHLETAVDLVRAGAADYLGKPWDDRKLVTTVLNLQRLRAATEENRGHRVERGHARRRLAGQGRLCGLVYESDAMHQLVTLALRVAQSDVPVLITGPNGSGKEKIAEIIQANSPVADGPFVKVNVGALPAELMSAELFGAEAGAYTGASKLRVGRFEAADGGTLFLDELGTLPAEGQVKLLRVLQTGQFERLGSHQTRSTQVRLICATNADLRMAVASGQFREDLYYRINVIELRVPPLAERPDDVLPLARAFLGPEHSLSGDAEQALLQHAWPGNVRELQNVIRRAQLLAAGADITVADLRLPLALRRAPADIAPPMPEPEPEQIVAALESADGVIATAARSLGLSRQALYRRMEKLGLHRS